HRQHFGLMIDAYTLANMRDQRVRRNPSAATDIENAGLFFKSLLRPFVRGRSRDCVGYIEEFRRMNPGALWSLAQNVLGDRPGLERLAPLTGCGHLLSLSPKT